MVDCSREELTRHRIVVGVATPEGSRAPLEWAMAVAARRDTALDVVHSFRTGWEITPQGVPAIASDLSEYEAAAKLLIDEAIDLVPVARRSAVRDIQHLATPLSAGAALVEASTDAELVVVGRRERHALPRLLGSITHQCVQHSRCPVAVVPIDWQYRPPVRIVVGVDGSRPSTRALGWALEEAARWDAELIVAHTWTTPYPVEPWGMVVAPTDRSLFESSSQHLIDQALVDALPSGAPQPRTWKPEVVEDASGPGLVRIAADADLLVVGSRGRGGFASLFLGSTSLQCLHHATCPVVVTR
jgi:nucleotide-binding universal stress UspA family protein